MWSVLLSSYVISNSCDSMDCRPPGPSVHGIFQARILEWLPFASPEDLPNRGIQPVSLALASGFFITGPPGKQMCVLPIGK